MKIAFVGGFAVRPKGTMQSRALPLAAEIVRQGHEVKIFVTPYDNPAESGQTWRERGVEIAGIANSPGILNYPRLLSRLINAVASYQPDLIHIFKPKGFAGAAGTYFHLKGMRNIVLDCDDWEGCGGFNDVKSYPWIVKEYIDRQERWMMRSIPAVTAASRELHDRAVDLRSTKAGVYYLPNCGASPEDLQVYRRARSCSPAEIRREFGLPDVPTVFYSGHSDGSDDFEAFWRVTAPAALRSGASVIVVCDGSDVWRESCRLQYPEVNVFHFPRLPYETFLRLVWASDVVAFPFADDRIHRSKCSRRIIDYMTMGKPLVTSAIGQNKEYIVDGESGILVAPGDELTFSNKLEFLLQHAQLRCKLGAAAANRIRDKFSWSGEPLQQCLAAYQDVLTTTKTRRVAARKAT